MLLGYALFYVCRLAFSATKKTMIEQGAYTAKEIGYVGSAMLIAYAIGKFVCGFLADHANIRRMFAFGLFVSSLATMTVGFHMPAVMLMVIWFVNGFAQGSGSPCCVVSLGGLPHAGRHAHGHLVRERVRAGVRLAVLRGVARALVAEPLARHLLRHLELLQQPRRGDRLRRDERDHGAGGACVRPGHGVAQRLLGRGDVRLHRRGAHLAPHARLAAVGGGQKIALTSWAVWMVALSGGFFCMSRYAIIDWGIFFLEVKKGYATETAAWIITLNSIVGAVSSGLSGIISDRVFKGSRNELALIAGILNVTGLSLMMLVPFQCVWIDVLAMVCFGLAVGVLLTFLGGLMAVDLVPRVAAGAAAGVSSAVSGFLVGRDAATGKAYLFGHTFANGYTLDYMSVFWIGMALLSVICALSVWKAKPRQ